MTNFTDPPKALSERPAKLFVETTSRCNLRCAVCLKQSGSAGQHDGDLSPDLFSGLETAFPSLEALVLNGIGEPTLNPDLEFFIERARALMPPKGWIGFQSNGLLIDERRAARLVTAGLDRVCLSVDTSSAELFRTLRPGGEIGSVSRAISSLQAAKCITGRAEVQVGIEFVCMKSNIGELPSVLRWAGDNGATFAIVTQLLPYDRSAEAEIACDTNTSGALAFLRTWQRRACRVGVDLSRYPQVFMKMKRSDSEEEIVAFVKEMVDDAYSKGVSLHVDRLLARDEAFLQLVSDVFDEARATARDCGMALKLPEVIPRAQRRCDFVEEGCSFVSWDGKVHPCYFLWHRGKCYLGGSLKHVNPIWFGSVAEADVVSVWNSPAYLRFRQEVLRYDFPFCYDCNFALCDLVQTGDFEQDCYVGTVPCGACMWCTGLFNCLQ